MDSQASVSSSTSSVPLDLIHDQDNDFVDEIDEVNRIYFGKHNKGDKSYKFMLQVANFHR